MGTDFFLVCKRCLNDETHFHTVGINPVAHRWFGGTANGAQMEVPKDMSDDEMVSNIEGIAEEENLFRLGEIKANVRNVRLV